MLPLADALGVISCILFMHLSKVVFPHPEGPIKAVTQFRLNSILIFFNTSLLPNQAFNELTESLDSLLSDKLEYVFLVEEEEEEDEAESFSCLFPFVEGFKGLSNSFICY
jgi:hypothetical protein